MADDAVTSGVFSIGRRAFIKGASLALAALSTPLIASTTAEAAVAKGDVRRISIVSLNSGERFDGPYWADGKYLPDAQKKLQRLMRDHHNGQVHKIDPKLFDQLWELGRRLDIHEPFEVVCGYRSRKTNAMARRRSRGVAKQSLHMAGRAVDIRLNTVHVSRLADTAREMSAGGVGYYPHSDFVHIDTGAVRTW